MRSILLIAALFSLTIVAFSQNISNVKFEQIGNKVLIYYDLDGTQKMYDTKVYYKIKTDSDWGNSLQNVSGEIGENQSPGKEKVIIWDVLKEETQLSGEIQFKVEVFREKEDRTSDEFLNDSGTFTDSRDGQVYKWVKIGNQIWMGENLNYGRMISLKEEAIDNRSVEKYCYDNQERNCQIFGGLYQWDEIMQYMQTSGLQGICPDGWFIPRVSDWNELLHFSGGKDKAASNLVSPTDWRYRKGFGSNSTGFSILAAGRRDNSPKSFEGLGHTATIWTSELKGNYLFYNFYTKSIGTSTHDNKKHGFSLRCIKK